VENIMEDMKNPIRLLICATCRSVEELPPYSGDPRGDTWLREKEKNHLLPSGNGFHGEYHIGRIEKDYWISHKKEILEKLAAEFTNPGDGIGLGNALYDAKDNYMTDAMKCWSVTHKRTTDCGDYRTDKMRILPDTKAERKAEGLTTRRPNIFVCDLCPIQSIMEQRRNSEEFGYHYTT
jgi:hypothetical protein